MSDLEFRRTVHQERRLFHIDVANIPRDQLNEYIRALTLRLETSTLPIVNYTLPIVDYPSILR